MRHLMTSATVAVLVFALFAGVSVAQESSIKDRITEDVKGRRILSLDGETPEAARPLIRDGRAYDPESDDELEVVFLKASRVAGALRYAAFYSSSRKAYWTFVWGGPRRVRIIHGPFELRTVTLAMVEKALKKLITPEGNWGFYDGQFKEIEAMGQGAVPYLLELFRDESRDRGVRTLALEALGDMNDPGVIQKLRDLYSNEDYAAFRESIVFTLAKLGDRHLADVMLENIKKLFDQAKGNPQMQAQIYGELAHIYARLEMQREAIDSYKKAIELDSEHAYMHYYNMACAFSVMNRIDEGLDALKKAIEHGYEDYDWMMLDGDLNNLRKDPRFKKIVEKLRGK